MKSSHTVSKVLKRFGTFRYKLVFEGVGVGILVGIVVVSFRLILGQADRFLAFIGSYFGERPWLIPIWFVFLILAAGATTLLLKWEPMISGSGIPQLDGEMQGYFSQNWWRVLIAKFAGGILTIGSGLSLGREGPSIQLGAVVGKGFSRITKRMKTEEKMLITCGASAGLAAAFNAPLAGTLFALEEVHKSFSVEILLSSLAASITSDFISRNVFGLKPVFDFSGVEAVPLSNFWILILLGVVLGFFGVAYNWVIDKTQNLYQKLPNQFLRSLIPFLLAGVMLFVYPAVNGGGSNLVMSVAKGIPLLLLVGIFLLKFSFSAISFCSGVPGGIFLPMLVLGSLCGGIFHGAAAWMGADLNLQAIIIASMAGCFSAIVRAPVTGILLITEMTGNFTHMLMIALVSLIAYIVADLLHSRPIYEQLLRKMVLKQGKYPVVENGEKVLVEATAHMGASVCKKKVSEVNLPDGCLIVSVRRGEREIIPKGDTLLEEGDVLLLLCDEIDCAGVTYAIEKQCKAVVL